MPKRNDKRDTAKAEYIKRRRSGEKVNLKDLAEKLGVTYGTVRNWKRIDQWDDAVERKRGGQPGNKNSRGKRNAKGNPGGGAPNGNTNAEKDGAYSTVHLERLNQEERDWLDQMPTGANENNIYELKLLRIGVTVLREGAAVQPHSSAAHSPQQAAARIQNCLVILSPSVGRAYCQAKPARSSSSTIAR